NTINGLKGDLILLSWFWDWLRGCNVPDTNQTNRQQALARKHVLECDTNDRAVFKRTGRDVVIKRRFAETSSSNRIRDARRRIPADNQLRDRLLGGEFHFLVIDTETVSLDDRNAFQIAIVDPADPDRQLNIFLKLSDGTVLDKPRIINGKAVTAEWLNENGLTKDEARLKISKFVEALNKNPGHTVCAVFYNAKFDVEALACTLGSSYVYSQFPYVACIYELVKLPQLWVHLRQPVPVDYSLGMVCKRVGVTNSSPHCALADAVATKNLFLNISSRLRDDLLSLIIISIGDIFDGEASLPLDKKVVIDDYLSFVFRHTDLESGASLRGLRHALYDQWRKDKGCMALDLCTQVDSVQSQVGDDCQEVIALRSQLKSIQEQLEEANVEVAGLRSEVHTLRIRNSTQARVIAKRDSELLHAVGQVDYLRTRAIERKPVHIISPSDWF
ncbi:hypothetical protein THAOC_36704, partial [Thalassiosira oceanica]